MCEEVAEFFRAVFAVGELDNLPNSVTILVRLRQAVDNVVACSSAASPCNRSISGNGLFVRETVIKREVLVCRNIAVVNFVD